jgi:menaquinone-specific isochorismate synthase
MMLTFHSSELPDRPLSELLRDPSLEGHERAVWLNGEDGFIGLGVAVRAIIPASPDRFTAADRAIQAWHERANVIDEVERRGSGLIAFASFAFDDDRGDSIVLVPRLVIARRAGRSWLTLTTSTTDTSLDDLVTALRDPAWRPDIGVDSGPRDRPRFGGRTMSDVTWLAAVDEALALIASGALDKVVLARDELLWSRRPFDVTGVLQALHARFPGCFTFEVDGLVGASPELLLAVEGTEARSRVLAGSRARGVDAATDRQIAIDLLQATKDLEEHRLAAASVQAVLERACNDMTVDGPEVVKLANVQHLATSLRGRLEPARRSLELLSLLHPTAAVGGSPRAAALTAIRQLEQLERGRYAAPIGWTDAGGDGEWAIALRCARIEGRRAHLWAGAGIVAGSLPEDELAETRMKLTTMRTALGATTST